MPRSYSPEASTSAARRTEDRDRDCDGDRDRSKHSHRSSRHRQDDYDEGDRKKGSSNSSSSHIKHRSSSTRHRDDDHDDRDRSRSDRKRHHDRDSEDEEDRRRRKERKSKHRDHSPDHDKERAERKAKKAAKRAHEAELEEAAARAAAAEAIFYSAEDNPFHDSNLSQQFKWGKKDDRDKKLGLTPAEARHRDEIRRREAQEEVARLAAKRAQREVERQLREEEQAKAAREAESAHMAAWVAKEDDFHLEQARKRAAIRVKNNRAKPIDILAINLKWADPAIAARDPANKNGQDDDEDDEAGLEIDLEEPYNIFENLTLSDTEELYQDIQMYLALEKDERNVDFWKSMLLVCNDKLEELRSVNPGAGSSTGPAPTRIEPQVRSEMNQMLSTKSADQLLKLQGSVRAKLSSGEPVDVEYWESLLRLIVVWRAKAKLRDLHEVVLQNRLEYLRKKQRDEARRMQDELEMEFEDADELLASGQDGKDEDSEAAAAREAAEADAAAEEEQARLDAEWVEEMELPAISDVSKLPYAERRLPIITLADDRAALVEARRAVLGTAFVPRARAPVRREPAEGEDADLALYKAEASKALDVEEEEFDDVEEILGVGGGGEEVGGAALAAGASSSRTYQYEDKYRPRKPRYFNRVHTGYEWNKYNQTHYDTDNPPPKVVQGYKFNIFYPDLIDKTKAPTYRIIKESGNDETVLLRFIAGPPYEDVAFRIVNKQWDHKRGFRSSFDRGVLQLYFNFLRQRYRK
ncbi:hypothetical protein OC846_001198 [Tilletia horrida]|uniref:Splicing factor Cactin n=1 Tax=Tilletia horrida TaxID=155126 RepID=A0AAN6K043_9BASI|nr:hypothetical protein OC845_000228 [Tilletia horrida]KAK0556375.1 hypothetical protein OC846_001198 [Tilletia horrida]KAK0569275.1 hypothetical protein OC861_001090 [Tilletia horrida]